MVSRSVEKQPRLVRIRNWCVDTRLLRLVAISLLLTIFSFYVVQNTVVINVRIAYFSSSLEELRMRLGTALIIAGFLGFFIGLIAGRWRC
jgi:hypothetical protein